MKKEKESDRPHLFVSQYWPMDAISPVDMYNQVGMFPSRDACVLDELPEEYEDL